MTRRATDGEDRWYDEESGPIVRPYTVTRGRTRPDTERSFTLMDRVRALDEQTASARAHGLVDHARASLLELLRRQGPLPVVELAAGADLPVTVVRVVLGDLVDAGLARVDPPPAAAEQPDAELLREVIRGLRSL
ncbi:DUF742 domain-containing protein [Streptomyces sp. NPDC001070]